MAELLVCRDNEIPDGGVRVVQTDSVEIGVFYVKGRYYAYRNYCPHQGGPACEGVLMPQVVDLIGRDGAYEGQGYDENDMHIVCPWHSYEFHLSDGTHVGDKSVRLKKYEVVQRDGAVYVSV